MAKKPIFFRIRNFEKFQHYKDRNPPWIKLYGELWSDPEFYKLPDASKAHLLGLFILASKTNNCINSDKSWINHEICATEVIDFKLLLKSKFLEVVGYGASKMLADCEQNACLETETETETEKRENPPFIPPSRRSLTSVPETMPITDKDHEWALKLKLSIDLETETAAMIDWAKSKSIRRADWPATRRNWWREAQRRSLKGKSNGHSVVENNKRAVDEFMRGVADKARASLKSQPN